jgi:excisionase family DNA binding protein
MVPGTRVIDISVTELEQLVETTVQRVLDARLPKEDPKYFVVRDLEKLLGCSKPWIYKLIKNGSLNYRRIKGTRKIRFTQEDIDSFFKVNPGYKAGKILRKNIKSSSTAS